MKITTLSRRHVLAGAAATVAAAALPAVAVAEAVKAAPAADFLSSMGLRLATASEVKAMLEMEPWHDVVRTRLPWKVS